MKTYFLKDLETGEIDAIVFAISTTADEIEEIIQNIKETNDNWVWDDIFDALPADVKIIWSEKIEKIIY